MEEIGVYLYRSEGNRKAGDKMSEVMPMGYKEAVGMVQLIRELNKALNSPEELDKALYEMQKSMEKGATVKPDEPGNA